MLVLCMFNVTAYRPIQQCTACTHCPTGLTTRPQVHRRHVHSLPGVYRKSITRENTAGSDVMLTLMYKSIKGHRSPSRALHILWLDVHRLNAHCTLCHRMWLCPSEVSLLPVGCLQVSAPHERSRLLFSRASVEILPKVPVYSLWSKERGEMTKAAGLLWTLGLLWPILPPLCATQGKKCAGEWVYELYIAL